MAWMRKRRAMAAGLMAAGALALSACGSSGQQVQTVSMDEVAKASAASTAKVSVVEQVQGQGKATLEGEIDFVHRAVDLRGDLDGGQMSDDTADVPKEVLDSMGPMFSVMASADRMVALDDHLYLRADGQWWDFGGSDGNDGGSELDVLSPATLLDQLAKVGKVRQVGTEQVRGAPATHYTATSREGGDRYEVWVDDQGRAVRIRTSASRPSKGDQASETIELYDFGTPVHITAPKGAKPIDGGTQVNATLQQVAEGTADQVVWQLSKGSTTDGRPCVQVDTAPQLDGEAVVYDATGMGSSNDDIAAGGIMRPSCGPSKPGEVGGSGATLLTVGGRKGTQHYMAGLLDPGAKVTVTFHDGHTEQLEGHDGAFVLFFQGDDWPVRMAGANTECELQGDRTMSGADVVC